MGSEGLVEGGEMSNSVKFVMDLAFENVKLHRSCSPSFNVADEKFNKNKGRGVEKVWVLSHPNQKLCHSDDKCVGCGCNRRSKIH